MEISPRKMVGTQRRSISKSGPSLYLQPCPSEDELKTSQRNQFTSDIEKQGVHSRSDKSFKILYLLVVVACLCIIGGTITNTLVANHRINASQKLTIEKFQQDQDELLSKILDSDVSSYAKPSYVESAISGEDEDLEVGIISKILSLWRQTDTKSTGSTSSRYSTSSNLLDLSHSVSKTTEEEELLKLEHHNSMKESTASHVVSSKVSNEGNAEEEEEEDIDAQSDLREMLSVSPLTILVNQNPLDSSEQSKAIVQKVTSIIKGLNITPQPVFVKLYKHPHYRQLVNYLKTYQSHALTNSGDELEGLLLDTPMDAIPSVFISGVPVGSYNSVIEMHKERTLATFLRTNGKGRITVE
ncbi:hypothetical protein CAAN1_11S02586 [[Candida] anglica]|uniref:Glutaredoxin domain-containing protein n=1 Tax=[Candida] anglica TaxID=148631 RepID=A0ABP0EIE8_9ASCO